jgi:hypothetical protein
MSEEKQVTVHTENDEATARIVVGFLQSNGIEATIAEDDAGDQLPSLEAVRGVQVLVAAGDAERARRLLKEREEG